MYTHSRRVTHFVPRNCLPHSSFKHWRTHVLLILFMFPSALAVCTRTAIFILGQVDMIRTLFDDDYKKKKKIQMSNVINKRV